MWPARLLWYVAFDETYGVWGSEKNVSDEQENELQPAINTDGFPE
jgi:hypothetical protein